MRNRKNAAAQTAPANARRIKTHGGLAAAGVVHADAGLLQGRIRRRLHGEDELAGLRRDVREREREKIDGGEYDTERI